MTPSAEEGRYAAEQISRSLGQERNARDTRPVSSGRQGCRRSVRSQASLPHAPLACAEKRRRTSPCPTNSLKAEYARSRLTRPTTMASCTPIDCANFRIGSTDLANLAGDVVHSSFGIRASLCKVVGLLLKRCFCIRVHVIE